MLKKILVIAFILILAIGAGIYFYASKVASFHDNIRIYIPRTSTTESLRDTLITRLGDDFGKKVFSIWSGLGGNINISRGSYVIHPGEKAYEVANRIAKGRQTPVKVVVNVARTLNDLINSISSKLESSPDEIQHAMDSVFVNDKDYGRRERYTAAILPDTYEFYWNDSPLKVIETLSGYRDKYWNDERLKKADRLGFSPAQIVTLASIVEEESTKSDEQPIIAGLYINRLRKGMKLQADPTVKFALGDFSLRRITSKHLNVDSPYNTYKIIGLPPGPIRIPQKSTIDAVLNASVHNYLYMCAKEDFSGYHNFTSDYNTHLLNARRYAKALDSRNIH